MKLIILESPKKARTIGKFVSDEFELVASAGHITEIPSRGLNVNVRDGTFRPNIRVSDSKVDVAKMLRTKGNEASEVFLCTDPDREGERIAFDISCLIADKSKIKRATFHEITKKAVIKAINNPKDIDLNLVNSQLARQILDRIIGYTVSPLLWNRISGAKSAGRVQSVALRLIAERELQIEDFKPQKFWNIPVGFKIGDEIAWGVVKTGNKENRLFDEKKAEKIKIDVLSSSPVVDSIVTKAGKRSPFPPFDTAGMQKAASAVYGWSGKRTMDAAQKVYEAGLCTYHRTDSFFVSEDAKKACKAFITVQYGEDYLPPKARTYKKKSRSQEAHECIRPTSVSGNDDDWGGSVEIEGDAATLYGLIRFRFIASQMADVKMEKTVATISAGKSKVILEAQTIRFDGWTKVWPLRSKESILPPFNEGDLLSISEVQIKEHETRAPDRFNDGSLVSKMEKEGVGRPSTWAVLVENLEKRSYVDKKGRNFHLTDVGRAVYTFLIGKFSKSFMDIGFTSKVEEELDRISRGETDKLKVIKSVYQTLINDIG